MRTVLVVDDEPDVRQLLATYLDLQGFAVVTAGNGREALTQLAEHRPCVILLDLMMPVMDGIEFRQHQQKDPRWSGIPVVCLSAKHDAAFWSRSLQMADCVTKPFDVDHLTAVVRRYCREAGQDC